MNDVLADCMTSEGMVAILHNADGTLGIEAMRDGKLRDADRTIRLTREEFQKLGELIREAPPGTFD